MLMETLLISSMLISPGVGFRKAMRCNIPIMFLKILLVSSIKQV